MNSRYPPVGIFEYLDPINIEGDQPAFGRPCLDGLFHRPVCFSSEIAQKFGCGAAAQKICFENSLNRVTLGRERRPIGAELARAVAYVDTRRAFSPRLSKSFPRHVVASTSLSVR